MIFLVLRKHTDSCILQGYSFAWKGFMSQPKILAFAGSLRKNSFNKKLVQYAASLAQSKGAHLEYVDLSDLNLPLYNGDIEDQGFPKSVHDLKQKMIGSTGFMIACPEYNGSITAALKNMIDWASRPEPDEAPLIAFRGKVVSLMACSPGALGGIRGLPHNRTILSGIGCLVLPTMVAVSKVHEVLGEDGVPQTDFVQNQLNKLVDEHIDYTKKLA